MTALSAAAGLGLAGLVLLALLLLLWFFRLA